MSIFGTIIDGGQVERAVRDTLRVWLRSYLVEVERQNDREPGRLPFPRGWDIVNSPSTPLTPDDPTALWLVSAGLDGEPDMDEDGRYSARWLVPIAVTAAARKHEETLHLVRLYTAAIRAALVQHGSLDGFATRTEWVDEAYDEGPTIRERTLGVGTVTFRVHVDDVTTWGAGPLEPLPDPDEGDPPVEYPDAAPVDEIVVTVSQLP